MWKNLKLSENANCKVHSHETDSGSCLNHKLPALFTLNLPREQRDVHALWSAVNMATARQPTSPRAPCSLSTKQHVSVGVWRWAGEVPRGRQRVVEIGCRRSHRSRPKHPIEAHITLHDFTLVVFLVCCVRWPPLTRNNKLERESKREREGLRVLMGFVELKGYLSVSLSITVNYFLFLFGSW